jgi:flagella basal body P-ring formation protein FlgA
MMRTLTITLAFAFALPAAALAQDAETAAPALKRAVTVASAAVRIGDLVQNAGAAADIPVFRAPDLGQTGAVPVATVLDALRPYGLTDVDAHGLAEITVTRASRDFSVKQIEHRIAATFAGRNGLGAEHNLALTFDRDVRPIDVEPSAGDLEMERAVYDPSTGRFDVVFEIENSTAARHMRLRYTGTLVDTVEAVVLQRSLARGEIIKNSDVLVVRRPRATIGPDTLTRLDRAVGFAVRNAAEAGRPLRASEIMKPELIHRDDAVMISYAMPGLTLNLRGKALDGGANGEIINVLNAQSKRTVQGIVAGPGRVTLVSATPIALSGDDQPTASIPRPAARPSAE